MINPKEVRREIIKKQKQKAFKEAVLVTLGCMACLACAFSCYKVFTDQTFFIDNIFFEALFLKYALEVGASSALVGIVLLGMTPYAWKEYFYVRSKKIKAD